ncbi:MAG: alcohol dehydrogenase catalytic domain-containing protein [Candidatus Aminicenantes bacterium]|nr:MAG: alcohol dehydrogenase catalytic domain-containing protein [Candidatus Aminicenantes bacterium]
MKAIALKGRNICVEERPDPVPTKNEALIRVTKAGICNTDLELVKGYMNFEGILGHEFVGRVVEACEKEWIGRRVVGEINIPCGQCEICFGGDPKHCPSRMVLGIQQKDGVFAEFVTLPLENLHALPSNVSEIEAVFVEPLAAAIAIIDQIYPDQNNDALILGDGKLGLLAAQVLQTRTPNIFCVGRHPRKLALIEKRGIQTALDAGKWDRKFDFIVDATGNPQGIAEALCFIKPKGKIVIKSTFEGLAKIDISALVVSEIQLLGSRCGSFAKALEFLKKETLELESMVDVDFPLGKALEAFERAKDPEVIKVLLTP